MAYKSRYPELAANLALNASRAVEKTADDIKAGAQDRSRVDTGQMKSGWDIAVIGPFEREVGNAVEHTVYNEYGTIHMAPQPMLAPSVEDARPGFILAMGRLLG